MVTSAAALASPSIRARMQRTDATADAAKANLMAHFATSQEEPNNASPSATAPDTAGVMSSSVAPSCDATATAIAPSAASSALVLYGRGETLNYNEPMPIDKMSHDAVALAMQRLKEEHSNGASTSVTGGLVVSPQGSLMSAADFLSEAERHATKFCAAEVLSLESRPGGLHQLAAPTGPTATGGRPGGGTAVEDGDVSKAMAACKKRIFDQLTT